MKYIFYTYLFLFGNILSAQQTIYVGSQNYPSTNSFEFSLNGHYWTGNPEITIGLKQNSGIIMLKISAPFQTHYFKGSLILFLSNGERIECINSQKRDFVDNSILTVFAISKSQLEKLRYNRISTIRFTINKGIVGSESFTADNIKRNLSYNFYNNEKQSNQYETETEVEKLFKILETRFQEKIENLGEKISEAEDNGNLQLAIKLQKQLIELEPNSANNYNSLAWFYLLSKNYQLSIQTLLKAKKIAESEDSDADLPYINCNLAHNYLFLNQTERAISLYEKIIESGTNELGCEMIRNDYIEFLARGFDVNKLNEFLDKCDNK